MKIRVRYASDTEDLLFVTLDGYNARLFTNYYRMIQDFVVAEMETEKGRRWAKRNGLKRTEGSGYFIEGNWTLLELALRQWALVKGWDTGYPTTKEEGAIDDAEEAYRRYHLIMEKMPDWVPPAYNQ